MFKNIVLVFTFLLLSTNIFAKRFTNQYSEFELPSGWQCALEGTEWVCQSENKNRRKEAIIILAAKKRGQQDSLDRYQAYLKQNKTFSLPGGKTQVSEPKYTKSTRINNHQWIDSLHLASEVPGFYTRYLATVKSDLGIAVTFSVSKEHYQDYQAVFDKIVATLRVFRQKSVDVSKFQLKKGADTILDHDGFIGDMGDQVGIAHQRKKGKAGSGSDDESMLYIILGLLAAGFVANKKYGFLSKLGKGKKKSKKTKKKK